MILYWSITEKLAPGIRDGAASTSDRSSELKRSAAAFTGPTQVGPVTFTDALTTGAHPLGWMEKITNFLAPRAYSLCKCIKSFRH
jgi:hypothetical protein